MERIQLEEENVKTHYRKYIKPYVVEDICKKKRSIEEAVHNIRHVYTGISFINFVMFTATKSPEKAKGMVHVIGMLCGEILRLHAETN